MFKLLMIDDEKPVRTAIQHAGAWESLQISTVVEASQAQMGLDMLKEIRPDIVLVDIKMPVMNGIEFLSIAREQYPEIKYIIISGYDDFQYAQQAIKFGVFDYLLKPVNKTELNHTLSKAVQELNEERANKAKQLNQTLIQHLSAPLFKEKLLTTILEGARFDSPIVQEYKKMVTAGDLGVLYGAAVIKILNFNEICADMFKGDSFSCYFAITNVIDELCAEWSQGFSFRNSKTDHEIIVVVEVNQVSQEQSKKRSAVKLKEVIEKLKGFFEISAIASIGGFYSEIEYLSQSYNEAEAIMDSVNILRNHETVFIERKKGAGKTGFVSIANKKELLMRAFESGSIEYTRNILNDYFEHIKQTEYFSIDDVRKATTEFILMIEDISVQLGIFDPENRSGFTKQEKLIASFKTLNDFSEFVFQVVAQLFDRIHEKLKASETFNINRIKTYIDDNYFKDINLTMFSEQFYLSKEYLSKLFKDKFECGIYEYVLKVRMEKAKEMLDDPSIKIQFISNHVGFNDNNYFSKAFKKYFGISPTEYRNRYG